MWFDFPSAVENIDLAFKLWDCFGRPAQSAARLTTLLGYTHVSKVLKPFTLRQARRQLPMTKRERKEREDRAKRT